MIHLLFLVSVNTMFLDPPNIGKRPETTFFARHAISLVDVLVIAVPDTPVVAQNGKEKKKAKKARKKPKESKDDDVEKDLLLKDNTPAESAKAERPKNKQEAGIDEKDAEVEWDPLLGSGEKDREKPRASKKKQRSRAKKVGDKDDAVDGDLLLEEADKPTKGKKKKIKKEKSI